MKDFAYNKIITYMVAQGYNLISSTNEDETVKTELKKVYSATELNTVQIKEAMSNIGITLDKNTFVNNVQNDVVMIANLKADDSKYSLFKNPVISMEMPKDIEEVIIGTPSLMYNDKTFEIEKCEVENNGENKVLKLKLKGEQKTYEQSSLVNGTNVVIPLTIHLNKSMTVNKTDTLKLTYTNENINNTVYKQDNKECEELEVSLINQIAEAVPMAIEQEQTTTYEESGIKLDISQKVGGTDISNNGSLYERQIVTNIAKITNNSDSTKIVNLIAKIPDEMVYVELKEDGYTWNETYKSWDRINGAIYGYYEQEETKQINFGQIKLAP